MLGFDALAKLPLAASADSGLSGVLNVTQAGQTVSSAGKVQVKAALAVTQAGQTVSSAGKVQVKAALDQAQTGDTVSATGTVTLSEAPCVLRAAVEVHAIVAAVELSQIPVTIRAVTAYIKLSAAVSYPHIKSRTCWDVVADREAA